ncbi:AtpZ/AtpI family protein [Serpentinicella sp. ANB-PHB4]|uniref:AtpZ/AtpI family protein n=1 Tax=Serpentinicella sp. ANB-PHB4 TaxID=3074076 RepID=UPI002857F402|nr:AtpZ/AtpI family protein [Serpentinicella sp. ANB-PHB4]MDR5659720.1 AtpZ/AtpI family protein [Serpentinicella sp. ANB-PHB4]
MSNKYKNLGILENLALVTQIGISMIIPIIAGVYIGNWIDRRLNTGPIFLFILIICGIIVAFMNLFKLGLKDTKKNPRK